MEDSMLLVQYHNAHGAIDPKLTKNLALCIHQSS